VTSFIRWAPSFTAGHGETPIDSMAQGSTRGPPVRCRVAPSARHPSSASRGGPLPACAAVGAVRAAAWSHLHVRFGTGGARGVRFRTCR